MTDEPNPYAAQIQSGLEKQQAALEKQTKDAADQRLKMLGVMKEVDSFLREVLLPELQLAGSGLSSHGYTVKQKILQRSFALSPDDTQHVLASGVVFWIEQNGRQIGLTYRLEPGQAGSFFRTNEPGEQRPNANPFSSGLKPGRQVRQQPPFTEDLTKLYRKAGQALLTKEHAQDFVLDVVNELIPSRPSISDRLN